MTYLVASLSSGKGTWGHLSRLINDHEWKKVFILTNEFGKQNFKVNKDFNKEFVMVDARKSILDMVEDIRKELDGKISAKEVSVNLVSGSGREHMAAISALQKLELNIKMIALTKEGIKEI